MDDAVDRFQAASAANDIDAVIATLADDAELVSPISGRMVFRGRDDLRFLFTAVYGSLKGLRWDAEVGEGPVRLAVGRAGIGPLTLDDAMVFELAGDGRIRRIRPHMRPWLSLTLLALVLGPKVGRNPALVRRALRKA